MSSGHPGDLPPNTDPAVARVLHGLWCLEVTGPATAADVLRSAGGAGLTREQQRMVLLALGPIPRSDQPANWAENE